MFIQHLSIQNLRNISQADINLSPGINIIQGGNGAGKTTLLEAIYLLARVKSFRQTHRNTLIQEEKNSLTIFAKAKTDNGERLKIGLQRSGKENDIRVNGNRIHKLSSLAGALPIAIITPHSHKIIEEGPENRRRLLNWGVFHVKHQYQHLLNRYNRVLSQRNAAIKMKATDPSIWDEQLRVHGEEISILHQNYIDEWQRVLTEICADIDRFKQVKIAYRRGWDSNFNLKAALRDKLNGDRKRGFTSVGPHRADIQIEIDNNPVKQKLSRGQQKFLVTLLMLAQSKVQQLKQRNSAIILFDDFQSELDKETQQSLLSVISNSGAQAVLTVIEDDSLISGSLGPDDSMFHVEHGQFSRII